MRRKSTLTDALQFAWLHLDTGAVCRENGTSGDAPFASALELRGAVSIAVTDTVQRRANKRTVAAVSETQPFASSGRGRSAASAAML
jgi:hypothetical protein